MDHLKKYPMDHFDMLTPHEQLVETVLHISERNGNFNLRIYGTLCGPVEIQGGPHGCPQMGKMGI